MTQLLRLLRAIPAPFRFLGLFFLLVPVVYLLARGLGMGNKAWLFILGLLVIFLVLWLFNTFIKAREKQKAKQFEGNLAMQSRDAGVGKEEIREALADLTDTWQEAARRLREAGLSVYDLPWYLLIGEPQSGKSTTLQNSGIEFPVGREALSGAGGTRNCDWWFSNEAVILDTAGRFTFQEESAPDRHEWEAFLKLLRRYRKYCPINGVIVVIPATSLTEDAPDEIERKAKNIRDKLRHLQRTLDIRFPVFILVTKADRILGFAEFCAELDPVDQRQLVGWSNPEPFDRPWDPASFDNVFEDLVQRTHKLRLRFLQDQPNTSQVDKLFVFPEELAALREPLASYLHTIFAPSRFEEPFILRGFYVTSGVQQGRPIARACRDLLRVQVGDPQGVLESLESVFRKSRAFFIRDFYEKKLFREQGLIARTRAALKRDRVYQWVFRGLMAVTVLVALLLLLPAAVNLFRVLKPISGSVEQAERCLGEGTACDIEETYRLVYALERQKRNLAESSGTLRIMLQSAERNEISNELLPAIQGRLLRNSILVPLLESFEQRAGRLDWSANPELYPAFFDGVTQLARFREIYRATSEESLSELRAGLSIESVVTVCQALPGLDATATGQEIDQWLADEVSPAEVDQIFRSVVTAHPAEVILDSPVPAQSLSTFQAYWSIENLARWDWTLVNTYFKDFLAISRQIAELRVETGLVSDFERLGERFRDTWTQGTAHLQSPPSATAGGRPGRSPQEWVDNCTADYRTLLGLAPSLAPATDVSRLCAVFPEQWERLLEDRAQYAFLYQETEAEGITTLSWSDEATSLAEPLVTLSENVAEEAISSGEREFAEAIERPLGDRERIEAINDWPVGREEQLFAAVTQLEDLAATRPSAELEVARIAPRSRDIAAVGLALQVLPPAAAYLGDKLDSGCADCFNLDHADTFVPAANRVLSWARRRVDPALGHPDVRRHLLDLDDAVYSYLAEFVQRERFAAGGGSPGGFVRPTRASQAERWSEFVADISRWQPVSAGRAAPQRSGGLTLAALRSYARDNDRLRSLANTLERAQRSAASGRAPVIADELTSAVDTFKRCIAGLDDDPLRAWRQLARGSGEVSLDSFHVFSQSRRLADNAHAMWMEGNVEENAAALLSKGIRGEFSDRFRQLWREVDRCCRDRFPFITERQLQRHRQEYLAGYSRDSRVELWQRPNMDPGRRDVVHTMVLQTADLESIDDLFYRGGGLDSLFEDFAVEPIINGTEELVDFIGGNKNKLKIMRQWQRFLYGREDEPSLPNRTEYTFSARLLSWQGSARTVFLGERMGQVDLFGANAFRPSTDAQTGRVREIAHLLTDRPLAVTGVNEDVNGWTGRLEIRGGPLKLFYWIQMASTSRPRQDDRIWEVSVILPDYEDSSRQLEGTFELTFDRSLPSVFDSMDRSE